MDAEREDGRRLKVLAIVLGAGLLAVAVSVNFQKGSRSVESNEVPRSPGPIKTDRGANLAPPILAEAGEAGGSRLARLLQGKFDPDEVKLSEVEIYEFIKSRGTNAQSLATAFDATHDKAFLKVAAAKYPQDPLVQARVLMHDVFPEERGKWIEAFKQSAPGNAFGNLLAAREAMNRDDLSGALTEIAASRGKFFDDYTREAMVGLEEAYLASGWPVAEAKALGSSDVILPQFAQFKKLAQQIGERAEQYGREGAEVSQQKLLMATWEIGSRLREGGQSSIILSDLVGLAIQNIALSRWPMNAAQEYPDWPVAKLQARNKAHREEIHEGSVFYQNWLPTAPETEVISYLDRIKAFGEENALKWLRSRHAETGTRPE